MAMTSVGGLPPARDELRLAIADQFAVFQRLFGHRWAATYADDHARPAWLAACRHAGLSPAEIRRGLARASALAWPPSCGEFIGLCRPAAPSAAAALTEAGRWARGEVVEWSHPSVQAAARDVGSWQLRTAGERVLRSQFGIAYRQMVERHARGESLDPPTRKALPAAVRRPRDRTAPPSAGVLAEIDRVARLLGVSLG